MYLNPNNADHEVDTDSKLTHDSTSITFSTYERDDEGYYAWDLGAGNIGDFRYGFEIDLSAYSGTTSNVPLMCPLMVSKGLGTLADQVAVNTKFVAVRMEETGGAQKQFAILESDGTGFSASATKAVISPYDDRYYAVFQVVGTEATLNIYNDRYGGTLESSTSLTLAADETYRYALVAVSADGGGTFPTHYISGTIENINLNQAAHGVYGVHKKPPFGSVIDGDHPLAQGLVGCWLMNEGSGNAVADLANNADGVINRPDWVVRPPGYALYSPNSTDTVTIPDSTALRLVGGPLTILSAIKTTDSAGVICSKLTDGSPYDGWEFCVSRGGGATLSRLYFHNGTTWSDAGGTDVDDGVWHQVGVTNDGGTGTELWLDGASDGVSVLAGPNSEAVDLQLFTRGTYNVPLLGEMAYIYIYNRDLTAHEIRTLRDDPYCFIKQPSVLDIWVPGGAAPSGTVPPLFHHYAMQSNAG